MKLRRVSIPLAVLAGLAAAPAAAQMRAPRFQIITTAGRAQEAVLAAIAQPNGTIAVNQLRASTTLGLGVQATTPLRWLDLRLMAQGSRPRALQSTLNGGPTYQGTAAVSSVTLDAVVKGPQILDAHPYLLAGMAVRHFDFDQGVASQSGAPAFPDRTLTGAHLGAGIAWNVGRYDVYVEASRFYHRSPIDPGGDPGGRDQAQGGITFGFRIPVH